MPLIRKGAINVYPSDLNTYFYVVTAWKDRDIVPLGANTSSDDLENQFGNHLGSIDLALQVNAKYGRWLFYRQTAYEQGAVFSLVPVDDGLTGISLRLKGRHFVEGIVLENLFTYNQGRYISGLGNLFNVVDSHFGERISYMYNGARSSGWRYKQDEIGTPLFIMDSKSTTGTGDTFTYNAIISLYLGLTGHVTDQVAWNLRLSNTRYSYIYPRPGPVLYQFSSNLSCTKYTDAGHALSLALGYDQGDRLVGSVGLQFSYKHILR